jgi:predicted flap endonuclease-1-like 5' DNA nuclease
MRSDYILYALAAVFFIITATSIALVAEETQRSLWVVTTVVLGLFSLGLGYYQRPKTKTLSTEPAVSKLPATTPQPQNSAADDAHEREAFRAENVDRSVETQIMPVSTSPVPMQVVAPIPVLAQARVEVSATPTNELTRVKGIGEKRAGQLKALGISNIDELAKAKAEDIAAKLRISPKIVKKWVAGAKELAQ